MQTSNLISAHVKRQLLQLKTAPQSHAGLQQQEQCRGIYKLVNKQFGVCSHKSEESRDYRNRICDLERMDEERPSAVEVASPLFQPRQRLPQTSFRLFYCRFNISMISSFWYCCFSCISSKSRIDHRQVCFPKRPHLQTRPGPPFVQTTIRQGREKAARRQRQIPAGDRGCCRSAKGRAQTAPAPAAHARISLQIKIGMWAESILQKSPHTTAQEDLHEAEGTCTKWNKSGS